MTTTRTSTRRALSLGVATAVAALGLGMAAAPAAQAYGHSLPGMPPPKGDPILPYPGLPHPTAGKGKLFPHPGLPTTGVVVPPDFGPWFDGITPPPAAQ